MITAEDFLDALLAEITAAIDVAARDGYTLRQLGKICGCSAPFLSQIRSGERGPGITFVKVLNIHQGLRPWIKRLTIEQSASILDAMDSQDRATMKLLFEIITMFDQVSERNKGRFEELLKTIKEDDLKGAPAAKLPIKKVP